MSLRRPGSSIAIGRLRWSVGAGESGVWKSFGVVVVVAEEKRNNGQRGFLSHGVVVWVGRGGGRPSEGRKWSQDGVQGSNGVRYGAKAGARSTLAIRHTGKRWSDEAMGVNTPTNTV